MQAVAFGRYAVVVHSRRKCSKVLSHAAYRLNVMVDSCGTEVEEWDRRLVDFHSCCNSSQLRLDCLMAPSVRKDTC